MIFFLSKNSQYPIPLVTLTTHLQTDKRKMSKCLKIIKSSNLNTKEFKTENQNQNDPEQEQMKLFDRSKKEMEEWGLYEESSIPIESLNTIKHS